MIHEFPSLSPSDDLAHGRPDAHRVNPPPKKQSHSTVVPLVYSSTSTMYVPVVLVSWDQHVVVTPEGTFQYSKSPLCASTARLLYLPHYSSTVQYSPSLLSERVRVTKYLCGVHLPPSHPYGGSSPQRVPSSLRLL